MLLGRNPSSRHILRVTRYENRHPLQPKQREFTMKLRASSVCMSAILIVVGTVFWILVSTPRASAIPAFSRKYQTSCSTCHSDYPELNDFGEAFKKNGFKFPKDDETFVKEPPVLLGAKGAEGSLPRGSLSGRDSRELADCLPLFGQFHLERQRSLSRCRQPRSCRRPIYSCRIRLRSSVLAASVRTWRSGSTTTSRPAALAPAADWAMDTSDTTTSAAFFTCRRMR